MTTLKVRQVTQMFKLIDKKSDKYLVLDTDDGVIDEVTWEQLITLLQNGVVIEGCHETERGYHFDIDNSDYQVIIKGYKFRLYPNQKQQEYFAKCFGCCRFIWNKMLANKIEYYKATGENLITYPTDYKDEFPFLKEVDSCALALECMHLDKAYKNFFRNKDFGFPKFKLKRNNHKSFSTNNQGNTVEIIDNKYLKLPKSKYFGLIKIKISQSIRGDIKTVTISQVPSGKYYISMNVAIWYQSLPKQEKVIGIDLGVAHLLTTSDGDVIENPKTLQRHQQKLVKLQRQLAKKQRGSNNYNKARIKLAREHEKIANIRKDYLHKVSHKLVSENQVIISEKLAVSNMMKNHRLAGAIADAGWYKLTRQLTYKADWNFRTYYQVDTYYPSSQLCSICGYKNEAVKDLSIRSWICPNCGSHHDRDENAAINIRNLGSLDLGLIIL